MIFFLLFEAKFLILIALNTLWSSSLFLLTCPRYCQHPAAARCQNQLCLPFPYLQSLLILPHSHLYISIYCLFFHFPKVSRQICTPCLFSIVFRFPFSRQFCCVRPPSWIIIPSLNHTGIPLMHYYFQLCLDSRRQGWDNGSYISLVTKILMYKPKTFGGWNKLGDGLNVD